MSEVLPENWFYNGEPLAIDLPGCWRIYFRYHLLGQGRVGWRDSNRSPYENRNHAAA
jgi:hypothetical protein